MDDQSRRYLTTREIAQELGITPKGVLLAVRRGDLPQPLRLGKRGHCRFSAKAVQEALHREEAR